VPYSSDLTIPSYLLQMKEFSMNEKAVIALVMSYKEHGCSLKNKQIAQNLGLYPTTVRNITQKLTNDENPILSFKENPPSLLYNIDNSNIVLQNYIYTIELYCNTIGTKRKEKTIYEVFNNTSTEKKLNLLKQRKEKRDFEFEEFWRSYPKQARLNKSRCYLLYYKAKDGGASAASLHIALESWKQGKLWKEGYVCHCQKWFNQERYLEHPEPFDDSWTKMW